MSDYQPIDDLVPHGPPLRALDAMDDWAPGRADCSLTLRPSHAFVKDGRVHSVVALEYMAQAVAACLGQEAFTHGEGVRVGMIVGVRQMEIRKPTMAVGDRVHLHVERVRGSDDVSTFRGETRVDDEVVATALMTIVHSEKPPE